MYFILKHLTYLTLPSITTRTHSFNVKEYEQKQNPQFFFKQIVIENWKISKHWPLKQ